MANAQEQENTASAHALPQAALPADRVQIKPLKGYGAFDIVFRHGARFAYKGVTGFILFRHVLSQPDKISLPELARFQALSPDSICVGVTAKKRTRPAVMRNRIKRLLRASVQKTLWESGAMPFRKGEEPFPIAGVIFICNIIPEKPSLLGLQDIQPLVERIFQNAERYFRSRRNSTKISESL